MGVELCGQPLTWADVRPFLVQFKRLDVSGTGKLVKSDLEAYVELAAQACAKAKQGASRSSPAARGAFGFKATRPVAVAPYDGPGREGVSSRVQSPDRAPDPEGFRGRAPSPNPRAK